MYSHFFIEQTVIGLIEESGLSPSEPVDLMDFCFGQIAHQHGAEVLATGPFNLITSETPLPSFGQAVVHLDNDVEVQVQTVYHTTPLPKGFDGIMEMMEQAAAEGSDFSQLVELTIEELNAYFKRELSEVEAMVVTAILIAREGTVNRIDWGEVCLAGTKVYFTMFFYNRVLTDSACFHCFQPDIAKSAILH